VSSSRCVGLAGELKEVVEEREQVAAAIRLVSKARIDFKHASWEMLSDAVEDMDG